MPLTTGSYGTLGISDLLAVNNTSIIDFGRQDVFAALREYFDGVNMMVNEQIDLFATRMTERVIGAGGPVAMVAHYTDEWGVPDAQKLAGPSIMGLPLRKSSVALQWTYQWMRKHTPAEMAAQAQSAAVADLQKVQTALRTAIFTATNNNSFSDRLVDNMTIPIKAFANADSFPIFPSPNGDTFNAATHSHYLGTSNAQPSPSDIQALLLNVTEHRSAGTLYLYVPASVGNYMMANGGTYTDFVKATYVDQIYADTVTRANVTMNPINQANRMIGVYQGAQVWVKPWVPSTVIWAFIAGQTKPLGMRVPNDLGGDNGDFRPIFNDNNLPLECEVMEREFGFAPINRTAASVLSFGGSDTSYVQPSNL